MDNLTTTPGPAHRFLETGLRRALDEHDRVLWTEIDLATQGGKRFRPRLLLGAHAAFGGLHPAAAERLADALELLHTAFVIHDDVIDGDRVRRGRPNVIGTFTQRALAEGAAPDRAGRYGEAAGILAGDLVLTAAVREIALCGAPPATTARLLDLLEDVLHRSAAGELADVRVSVTPGAGLTESLAVAEWKTAAYSFQLPLQAGALLAGAPTTAQPAWPEVTAEAKPWTRWWWMGSAVDEAGLTAAMEAYRDAGLGGLEITPIYGVVGVEERFIDYLSPAWMDRLGHVLREADRLGLGIDMATGTGWPFGGPWVTPEDASKYVIHRTFELASGERLAEPIRWQQEPMVRAVPNQVYELYGFLRADGEAAAGSMAEPPPRPGSTPLAITDLVEPIAANDNLQALALEQVRFPHDLPLQVLMAYADAGEVLDLTGRVGGDGRLDWTAPEGDWTLYAVFQGDHGKMVERAAPGGEGLVIDHFSEDAIDHYLARFDEAFAGRDLGGLRGFFNDSYEVDDARGQANWTPALFEAFEARRGYDLRRHLPALFGDASDEENERVLMDYRQTVSDLLLETFTDAWRAWAHENGALVRNQAHGSPANILDLYAASDIPETEGTDLLRFKSASSAANVTGKRLVSAEAATWLNEHFTSSLADLKRSLDGYFLGGVNHVLYHGTNYSPPEAPWPGWLFYAAVHVNPQNPLWRDLGALNAYGARVQAFLQRGAPANDVLLYFPISDYFAARGPELLTHFDGGVRPLDGTSFDEAAEQLLARGYAFDFISDRQLQGVAAEGGGLTAGGNRYQTVVLPESRYIPLETFERIVELAEGGATVVVHRSLPGRVAGLGSLEERQAAFEDLTGRLAFTDAGGVREAALGEGVVLIGDDLEALLARAGVRREAMTDRGLQFVRRTNGADDAGETYFIVNGTDDRVSGWVPVQTEAIAAALYDPMRGTSGLARTRPAGTGGLEVYLQLDAGASAILQASRTPLPGEPYPYAEVAGAPLAVGAAWSVRFVEGGPELPPPAEVNALRSWTDFAGDGVGRFAGTAVYTTTFARPHGAQTWLLDLGEVYESAVVRLNGAEVGTLIGPAYRLPLDARLFRDENTLEIEVTNLMANRIADLDRQGATWKRFYNVNFPAWRAENRNAQGLFDASAWAPRPSGLLGPVTLTPLQPVRF